MSLKIIGAGFGRTGTLSLKHALEELGFGPCYHMAEIPNHPEHIPEWRKATRGEPIDWVALFQDYQATVDWPGCTFWREILEVNPDAKVLLSLRDPHDWHRSVMNTIYHAMTSRIPKGSPQFLQDYQSFSRELCIDRDFSGRLDDEVFAIEVFKQHTESVRAEVPAEQLIEYEVGSGWEPLCEALQVDIPDTPYPRMNSSVEYQEKMDALRSARKREGD
ncbi:MAG: sulfotransferase family protein [Pseudomonadota bacterium]